MAFTRKFLKALGIEEEKIDQIMDAHVEVMEGIKADADKNKDAAAQLTAVQKELDDLKAAHSGENDYKAKYEKEHTDFEAYKAEAEVERLYRAELTALGITGKRADQVLRVSDLSGVKVADGKLEDAEGIQKAIREDWADFIPATQIKGQRVDNPPANTGGKMTREEIFAIKDQAKRQAAIAQNMELFEK